MRFGVLIVALCGACQTVGVAIPEPLVFDLVRPLGARKGELEANVLATGGFKSDDPVAPLVAPEIEYALADGLAVEFELPFEEHGLAAVKLGGQWTFGGDESSGFIHGTQAIAERWVDEKIWDLSLLYIPAMRFGDTWSVLGMFGGTAQMGSDAKNGIGVIANLTIFADLSERVVLGFESDAILFGSDGSSLLLMPQAHYEFTEHFTLQFGVGVMYFDGNALGPGIVPPDSAVDGWFPQVSLRAVWEF